MAEPFLGEVRLMSFNFAPKYWASCDGQMLPINQNQALFSLLGTTYGGNGQTTFGLPDLRGRVPMHVGGGYMLGTHVGEEAHTLTTGELPTHAHVAYASASGGDTRVPAAHVLASASGVYGEPGALTSLGPATVGNAGGGQAHLNLQPSLALMFCIAIVGIFPSPN